MARKKSDKTMVLKDFSVDVPRRGRKQFRAGQEVRISELPSNTDLDFLYRVGCLATPAQIEIARDAKAIVDENEDMGQALESLVNALGDGEEGADE